MTTHRVTRCAHCGSEYEFQASGPGCHDPFNDGTWCPVCKRVIAQALAKVPRLYECRYRDIKEMPDRFPDVTLEQVLEWERENLAPRAEGRIVAQRIFAPLFNLKTGDAQNVREVRAPNGQRFMLATWSQSPDYEIKVPWEFDLQKGCWTNHPWRGPG